MTDSRTPDLLDVLRYVPGYVWPDLPDGLVYGWRNTRADLRSRGGFRWSWPDQWTEAPDDGRDLTTTGPACPSDTLGGLCLAKTWRGARSGGISSAACLLVAYSPDDVLGEDHDKIRVRRALTLDVVDVTELRANLGGANLGDAYLGDAYLGDAYLGGAYLRGADLGGADLGGANLGYADLGGANLGYAYLGYADLGGADLGGANLGYAYLGGADLEDADLGGANLRGAHANEFTRLPAGWVVTSGRIVRADA